MSTAVTLEVKDRIGLITFNRPEAMNTFTGEMLVQLGDAYRRCDGDDTVSVVVVTGSGAAFCAGADLSDGGHTFDSRAREDISSCPLSMQAWQLRKPVIAACNGHAIGVGLGIAAQCDMRIVAREGKYGFLQNRRGVVTDFGMTVLLPKLVGAERAFELLVRARKMTGAQLSDMGLASRVLPAAEVLPEAMAIAADMVKNCSPLVMALHKKLLWKNLDCSLAEGVANETQALNHSMCQPDALEGGVAFFEKRAPHWKSSVNEDWPQSIDG